jgi:hypothetical protein
MAALRYHGMLCGLLILLTTPMHPPAAANIPSCPSPPRDGAFVRLLANLLLHSQSEATHVC